MQIRYSLFETPIGACGIAWTRAGVAGVQLPEAREATTREKLLARFPDAEAGDADGPARRARDGVVSLLEGAGGDLSEVLLDWQGVAPFGRRVYEAARAITPGATSSYGEIAARIGAAGAARAVGHALGRNPFAIIVPCHRVLAAGGRLGGFTAHGGIARKLELLSIESAHAAGAHAAFDGDGLLGFDPQQALGHLRRADRKLGRLIDEVGAFDLRLTRTPSLFAALAQAIVYQQLNGRAAATIHARVRALFPHTHDGPTPEQILRASERRLRGAGLSGAKLLSLRDLARRTVDGTLPSLADLPGLDDEAIVARLTEVRGIGRWTAQMLLIFRLGRPDVLPLDDYGVRKGFAAVFGAGTLPARADLERRGARWKPYRSVASWYLWRAAERAAG